ncbi:MAG: c-type cytochrome [Deltaproteobacteria bacterium]|nr:c-type cytochrome [Deltaproteobacteria bacterium]
MKQSLLMVVVCALLGCAERGAPLDTAQLGKQLYTDHCLNCHGERGDGRGPLAPYLQPRPRDLTTGVLKYRTTHGPIPSDIDLLQTLKMGIPGTSMPGWNMLTLNEWKALLSHIKRLSPRFQEGTPGPRIDIPPYVASSKALVAEGGSLFHSAGCVACHGVAGDGRGIAAPQLKDLWGDTVIPRDLTHGPLKWGNREADIYRTLLAGIPGTPMPGYEQTLTKSQLWALVHYIKSIQQPVPKAYDPSNPQRHLIPAGFVKGDLPIDGADARWTTVKAVPVFLHQLQAVSQGPEWLSVKALHNGREILFAVQWADDRADRSGPVPDAVGLQFPLQRTLTGPAALPFVGMGSGERPVQIWQWSARGVQEFIARGVGQLEPILRKESVVIADGTYTEGQWQVLLRRSLAAPTATDAELPREGYLSFALWDGDQARARENISFSEWMIYSLASE